MYPADVASLKIISLRAIRIGPSRANLLPWTLLFSGFNCLIDTIPAETPSKINFELISVIVLKPIHEASILALGKLGMVSRSLQCAGNCTSYNLVADGEISTTLDK